MGVCVATGAAVVVYVARGAVRDGREVLAPMGEEVVLRVKDRVGEVASVTREKAGDLLSAGRSHQSGSREG